MLKFPLTPHKINNNNNNNDDKLNPSESTTTSKSSSTTTNKKINQRHLLSNINVLEVLVLVQFVDHGKFDVMQKFIYLVQIVLHLVVIVYFQKLKRGNQSGESKAKKQKTAANSKHQLLLPLPPPPPMATPPMATVLVKQQQRQLQPNQIQKKKLHK